MRPTSVARWGLPAAAAGGRRRRRANTAAVEKIEGSVSLKIFSGTARRREAITRRSLVQILPPQPRRRGRHIVRGDDFSCRTIVTSRSFCRGSFQTRSARLRVCQPVKEPRDSGRESRGFGIYGVKNRENVAEKGVVPTPYCHLFQIHGSILDRKSVV